MFALGTLYRVALGSLLVAALGSPSSVALGALLEGTLAGARGASRVRGALVGVDALDVGELGSRSRARFPVLVLSLTSSEEGEAAPTLAISITALCKFSVKGSGTTERPDLTCDRDNCPRVTGCVFFFLTRFFCSTAVLDLS